LWWGAGPALFQWKDGQLAGRFDLDNEPWLRGDRVTALCEDVKDGLWVGTFNGQLRQLQNGTFISVGNLGNQNVTALVQQHDGALWVGTFGGGLIRIQDGKQTAFTESDDGVGCTQIRTLFLDRDEVLWIGTAGGGLGRWKAGKCNFYGVPRGLVDDDISQIVEDDNDDLWLGSDHGIMRVNKAELEQISHSPAGSLHPEVFGRREGMLSEQCATGFHGALKTATGQLWFSTSRGIAIIDPRQHADQAGPPGVVLEKILVDGKNRTGKFWRTTPLPLDEPIPAGGQAVTPEIEPGAKEIQFHFTGLGFDAPERIQFRCHLDNVDSGWRDVGTRREADYAHLAPGKYVFRVIACNAQGLWNETGASTTFILLPYFWQRGWVISSLYASGSLAIAGVILLMVRRRYQNRLKLLEMERAMENERSRIARDLHDEVGSSLTRISMLSEQVSSRLNDPEQLKLRAGKLSDFAVRATRAFEEVVWAVNPRNDSLRSLLEYLTHFADELFENSGLNCRFRIPDDLPEALLPPDTRHSLFLALKEALNNALKHSGASQVTLQVDLDSEMFQVLVQDNGRGFDLAAPTPEGSGHNGLRNMRQRVEHLGGEFLLETQPGHGTTIRVRLAHRKLAFAKPATASSTSKRK
jgi:signal transduction histidine kinase